MQDPLAAIGTDLFGGVGRDGGGIGHGSAGEPGLCSMGLPGDAAELDGADLLALFAAVDAGFADGDAAVWRLGTETLQVTETVDFDLRRGYTINIDDYQAESKSLRLGREIASQDEY